LANSHRAESEAVNRAGSGIPSKQHIIPHLGTLRLSEFTVKVVQAFSTGLISGRTRKTVENVLQTLFSILQTARRFGSAVRAVSRADIVLPNGGVSREVRFFDAEQVGKIVAAEKEPYSTMFAVLGMTGLRAGEMLGLKVADLDFTRKVIHVRRSIDSRTRQEQTPKSRGSASDVPMPGALEKRLLQFLALAIVRTRTATCSRIEMPIRIRLERSPNTGSGQRSKS
jgi:integrase